MALLTEDRKRQGLVLAHSVRENFGLPNLGRFSRLGVVRERAERGAFASYVESLRIRIPHQEQPRATSPAATSRRSCSPSGWSAHCEVVIFDEPTRGIDVGAKYEIYQLINDLAAQGKAILMISSELPEVLGMGDRILVMHDGRLTGEIADVPARPRKRSCTSPSA